MFKTDYFFMKQALMLAKRGSLTASPNPVVGCIIVKDGVIVGEGYHMFPGGRHAETNALLQAGEKAAGSTVYVTLEPCCHFGKTGPCADALIKASVKKVVVASYDSNPIVRGKGVAKLKEHKIDVVVGVLHDEAVLINKIYFCYHNLKRPYIISKWGMSANGKTATQAGQNPQITSKKSQTVTHDLRNSIDSILVGANTILQDNPKLNVRFTNAKIIKQPLRIVVATNADDLPEIANIYDTEISPTLIACVAISKQREIFFKSCRVKFMLIKQNAENKVDIVDLIFKLREIGITSILVEGGESIHNSFFKTGLVDEAYSFLSPSIINDHSHEKYGSFSAITELGEDILMQINLNQNKDKEKFYV